MESWLQRFFDKVNDKYPDMTSEIIEELDKEELQDDPDEVTHEVFFGEEIKRFKNVFKKLADL